MSNIKFSYLYRDSGNYKKFDSVVFANPDSIGLSEFEKLIRSKLIWGEWFYADAWQLPELFLEIIDFRVDPTWHEFELVELTEEPSNAPMALAEFMDLVVNNRFR